MTSYGSFSKPLRRFAAALLVVCAGLIGCSRKPSALPSAPTNPVVVAPLANPALTGSERFVIYAREGRAREARDWERMEATAWDFDPDRPEQGLVRRVTFGRSHWNAYPLLWPESDDASEFVRLQVNVPGSHDYTVRLYRIDFKSWQVQTILACDQVLGLGSNAENVYVDTSLGYRAIRRNTAEVQLLDTPFKRVRDFGGRWIVEVESQRSGASGAFFDLKRGVLLSDRFVVPASWSDPWVGVMPSPDHRRVAYWDRRYRDDPRRAGLHFGEPPIVLATSLYVLDLASGKIRERQFRARCAAGSGVPVRSWGPRAVWSADGAQLKCVTLEGDDPEAAPVQLTLDAATLEIVSREVAPAPTREPLWVPLFLPEYLRADYDSLATASEERGRRVALAFLKSHGVSVDDALTYGDSSVAFSPDGRRMLIKLHSDFYFGDLQSKQLRRIPTPPELEHVVLDIHCVRAR